MKENPGTKAVNPGTCLKCGYIFMRHSEWICALCGACYGYSNEGVLQAFGPTNKKVFVAIPDGTLLIFSWESMS